MKLHIKSYSRLRKAGLLSGLATTAFALSVNAQSEDDVIVLDEATSESSFIESIDTYSILPIGTAVGIYGSSRSFEETPRAVTEVDSSLIDLFGIETVNDFVSVTAGAFTGNYFGVPGALDVRGERADNFFRGFRRVENRGNFPTVIPSAQYVEILKGPPPPIYGGGKVGGILNYVPKSARSSTAAIIDAPTGKVSATFGTYDKKVGSFEIGVPFQVGDVKTGMYLYTQIEDSQSYYDNVYNKNEMIQIAFDTDLTDTIRLEYGGMAQWADLNQSLGWNRVTQDLIDSEGGEYLSGSPIINIDLNSDGFLSPSELGNFPSLEQFVFPGYSFPLFPFQQTLYSLNPATVGLKPISHKTVQAETIDFSESEVYTFYFDFILDLDNVEIKNQSFYDDMNHTKYSSYGFTADYQAYVVENKTTVTTSMDITDYASAELIGGFSYRYSDGNERESRGRGYQVLDRRDLTVGATGNDRFEGADSGTGNVPYNFVQTGDFSDAGFFGVADFTLFENAGLILGGRWDNYQADTFGTDGNGAFVNASDSEDAFSYNASITYKITDGVNFYATYAESNYLELGQGGMIAVDNINNGTWIQESELQEVGFKGRLFDSKLFYSAAYYNQEKTSFNSIAAAMGGSPFDTYESQGLEIELRYAPTKNWSFTAAATWQKTELLNAPFFLGIPPEVLGIDPALAYGGRFIGVGGLIGINGPLESPTPEYVFSFNATYTADAGWGASLGATHVAAMDAGYTGLVKLPSYTTFRAALFYEINNWTFRINADNIFDEKYYTPQFLFWDSFVSPSQGPTANLTVSYEW
jgi:iron complex outermembrane receptor protein